MEDSKEVTEKFVKVEARTEFDAVHPRFYKDNPEEILKYQTENHYYCKECNFFFAPTLLGLETHFKEDMKVHTPYASCRYCSGKVYEYSLNRERQVYHNCRKNDS